MPRVQLGLFLKLTDDRCSTTLYFYPSRADSENILLHWLLASSFRGTSASLHNHWEVCRRAVIGYLPDHDTCWTLYRNLIDIYLHSTAVMGLCLYKQKVIVSLENGATKTRFHRSAILPMLWVMFPATQLI